jgi:hypothetical protein
MRSSPLRLIAATAAVVAVISCDGGTSAPRFGNGISGGPTGTAPVNPPAPGSPDTSSPFIFIQTPATTGQLINIGDSILVTVVVSDDRQLGAVDITGFKEAGDTSFGTFTRTVRYPTVSVPAPGGTFAVGQTSATINRYLRPGTPVDSATDSLIIMAIVRDGAGNVDTARRRVQLVTGPGVSIQAPIAGDSVPVGFNMTVTARTTSNVGVRWVNFRVQGETTWPAGSLLDVTDADTMVGVVRDTTISKNFLVPAGAPPGGRITITVSAQDINGNPGSAPPVIIFTRATGSVAPRVTQTVPDRLEIADSITIFATGDGIASVGFRILDVNDVQVKDSSVSFAAPFTSNVTRHMRINLSLAEQGQGVKILSYATDAAGDSGFTVASLTSPPQTSSVLARTDSATIVYGLTYRLPRPGTVGDIVVDPARSHVLISNMTANKLEVWQNANKLFDQTGVPVGSQPWGLALSITPNILLVSNSGGTNISRVNLGTGTVASIAEDLSLRIRTRTNFLHVVTEGFDNAGAVKYGGPKLLLYSDRPQYIGQINDGTIFFSTRPTLTAPEGNIRYLDPTQPFPDQKSFVFTRQSATATDNFVMVDIDSVKYRPGKATGIHDTIYVFDHRPGLNLPSEFVRTPTCRDNALGTFPGVDNCDPVVNTADPAFDPRFPGGLRPGVLSALQAIQTHDGTCSPNCSDMSVLEDVEPVGITDTTFVATSADRNWIAFGQGTSNPGIMLMANVNPFFDSPIITQLDLTNQAAERVFGIAVDSTGLTVAAHGSNSFFSAVDLPYHLRLQGFYADAGAGGAGIAYHPAANGNGAAAPSSERLAFVAAGDRTVHAVDIAYFFRRGRFELKHQLYGPLRVSRPLAGDDPSIILKLYGVSLEGGLTVIDLRAADISGAP